ncbi:hypothetical protein BKA60DRAFT_471064 [Fusarium oxysporum]|nr:hypothetical protein BKA60DRAFT_471064 [Fusarium oxysporum]
MFPTIFKPPFTPEHSLARDESSGNVPGFPRVHRHDRDQVKKLLTSELCSDDLDRVSDKLWWMSKQDSTSIWPLHRQLLQGRSIVVTENPKLHLVWINDRIFIKPLPRFIGSFGFWKDHLCSNNTSEDVRIRRAALGYLRTYFYLIQHESDFRIAKDPTLCLIPESITWEQFCDFTSDLDKILDKDVSQRYSYGQIRLTRLNFYAPVILNKSYFQRVDFQYGQYFARFYAPVLFAFGITSVTLSGLQVVASLETGGGANWQGLALGVSVLAILVSFGLLIGFGVLLSWKIAKEWKFAIKERRRLIKTERVVAASAMAASNHKNFRLRGIPLEYETRNEVCSLVQKTLALEPNASPTVYSLACSPTDPNSKIATLSFPSIPDCLSDRSKVEWSFNLSDDNDIDFSRSLAFDTHFTGFTPFHRASDNDCHIDLVAVCGLGGHALGSFKEKNGRFVWLRDALPSDIPKARIFTYGYNSQLDPNQPRSILFIGHSLGGLVIKETVRILKEEPLEPDFSILNAVSGFAFFGVPHRGLAVKCLVPLVKDNPNRALLESLNKNSSLLEHLQNEFGKISKARSLSVVSFYETEKSPTAVWINGKWEMSGTSEVLVEVFSATCGCQKKHPINRNHSEMVKYSGVHDQLYRRVVIALRPILGVSRGRPRIGGIGEGPQVCFQLSGEEQECLKSLSFPEQEHRCSEISYASETCDWLLEDYNYQKWMNTACGLFWVKGCPGTGKSVLMKFAVDTMNRRKSGEIIASFFIHGRGIPLQRTPLGIFRALLNSLLMSFPKYLAELTEVFQDKQKRYGSYEQKNGWQWNEKELEKFLSRLLIEGTKEIPVVIFIDALDECGDHAKSLLVSLKSLAENAEQEGSLVRICFSSRHFPILGHETMAMVYVEEKNDQDIRLVIEGRLKEIQPVERRRQIEKEILLKAHGGFQWAILITNMVLEEDVVGTRTEDLLDIISTTPPDLDDLYDIILRGATKDKHKQMTKLFHWVAYTNRPLSAQELREALATDKDMAFITISQLRSQGNWSDDVSQFEKRVRHISRGLVEFQDRDVYEQYEPGGEEWNREAQFIHQSAADFVIQKFLTNIDTGLTTTSTAGTAHFEISRSFLKYLALKDIRNKRNMSRKQLSAAFPLLPYGVAYLLSHILHVEQEDIPQTDLLTLLQWDQPEKLKMVALIWRIMDPESTHAPRGWPFVGATVLHAVVAFGSPSLLNALLHKDESDLAGQDSEGNTPLHLALRENNEDLALMILDRSRTWQTGQSAGLSPISTNTTSMQGKDYLIHINATNHENETPLALALSIRAGKAIKSLIDAGAEVKNEKSLVFYAISTKDKALLSRLIEMGADLAGAVFFTVQCLSRVCDHDDTLHGILKDLLEASAGTSRFVGSEIEGYDEADGSDDGELDWDEEAIFLSSRHGRARDVSLLLSYGSSATLKNNHDSIPLMDAILNGNLETARVLLRDSPQTVQCTDAYGLTALNMAVKIGNFGAVQLLIQESGGRLTAQGAFFQAIADYNYAMAHAILKVYGYSMRIGETNHNGLDVPLIAAVKGDFRGAVQALAHSEVDVNVRDKNGDTPLHLAVDKKSLEMVSVLLATGKCEISLENELGYTPLGRAIANWDIAMVELLLSTDEINANMPEDSHLNPLYLAVSSGQIEVAKLLLDTRKVDISTTDDRGDTPLDRAINNRDEAMLRLLLYTEKVYRQEQKEVPQKTVLWAVDNAKVYTVQLLLEWGVFNLQRVDGDVMREIFWLAVGKGNERLINVVHDSGNFGINAKDRLGKTPLMHVTEAYAEETLKLLLKTGKADVHAVDNEGNTALSMAVKKGYKTVADLLSAYIPSTNIAIRHKEG